MSTLSERLIEARTDKGWNKAELRRAANLKSPSTLTELENGSRTESPQLPIIAAALGVSVLWLQHNRGGKHDGVSTASPRDKVLDFQPAMKHMDEISALAAAMSDEGRSQLLGMAKLLAAQYPAQANGLRSSH